MSERGCFGDPLFVNVEGDLLHLTHPLCQSFGSCPLLGLDLVIVNRRCCSSLLQRTGGKGGHHELKNDLAIRGILHSVDQYLNIKLENTRVVDQDKYPHMLSVRIVSSGARWSDTRSCLPWSRHLHSTRCHEKGSRGG
ncbi:hypothetical protein HPP92_003718 [Vanilla planifolia]|uniref:Sm domain-containing protein n=1 Tax=Vanilla planifolia TaxID=51239 RepID=A0A835S470_VANPL|nr:hypothetical protein HPP92_003718 [Vanilla planifolia]